MERWKIYTAILIVGVVFYAYVKSEEGESQATNGVAEKKREDVQKATHSKDKKMKNLLKKISDEHNKENIEDLANAKEVWQRLQEVGFNSDESVELIGMLIGMNGDYIYFKELRDEVRNSGLRDDVAAQIILALSGTYEGRGGDGSAFYLPKNKRDLETQAAIREEIISPHGKESLYMALEKLGYAESYESVMQTMQEMQEDENSLLSDISIYKLKIKYIGMKDKKDDAKTLVSEISKLDLEEQNKIMPTFTELGYSVGFIGDDELQKKYISLIKKNKPKEYEFIDHDKIRADAAEKVKQDTDFMDMYNTMNERDVAFDMMQDYIQKEYEEMQVEASKNNFLRDNSYRAIAYALSPDPADYIIGYKKAFLTESDWDEKLEYVGSFWNEVHTIGEDEVKEKFLTDKEIKSALEEGLNTPKMSQENKEAIDFYLSKFH